MKYILLPIWLLTIPVEAQAADDPRADNPAAIEVHVCTTAGDCTWKELVGPTLTEQHGSASAPIEVTRTMTLQGCNSLLTAQYPALQARAAELYSNHLIDGFRCHLVDAFDI